MTVGVSILGGQKVLNFVVTGKFSWGSLTVGTNDGNFISDYIVPIVAIILIVMGGILMVLNECLAFKQNSHKRIIPWQGMVYERHLKQGWIRRLLPY